MQIGLPYQYNQADKKLQKSLNMANIILRAGLYKVAPVLFAPQGGVALAAPRMFDLKPVPETMYSDALSAANRTTRNIWIFFGVITVVATKALGVW